jgi:hypothetical protein
VEGRICVGGKSVYPIKERRIDPLAVHNGFLVFAGTFEHEGGKDNAHIER